jgi:hypothetical protein
MVEPEVTRLVLVHPQVALARKLLSAVYALLRDGEVFDEEKFAAV